nr:MAG: putative capsid protein [Hainan jingmen-like virus]
MNKILIITFFACSCGLVAGEDDTNWITINKLMSEAQSACAKHDAAYLTFKIKQILANLPHEETTYYVGLSTGPEKKLVAGRADEIIGEQYGARLNQITRAADAYIGLDKAIKGLTVFVGGPPVTGVLEFESEYRLHPGGRHPVYAAKGEIKPTKNLSTGINHLGLSGHTVHPYLERGAVVVPASEVDLALLSADHDVNIVNYDVAKISLGNKDVTYLAVRRHIVLRASKIVSEEGDLSACYTCEDLEVERQLKNFRDRAQPRRSEL